MCCRSNSALFVPQAGGSARSIAYSLVALAFLFAVALVNASGLTTTQQQNAPLSSSEAYQKLAVKAANGEYDEKQAQADLVAEGKVDEYAARQELQKIAEKAKKSGKDPSKEQNPSGTGDWDFGAVYAGNTYKANYPLENGCKVGQQVTITYPTRLPLTGPTTVEVPAKSKIDVPMALKFPPPQEAAFVGQNTMCKIMADVLVSVHPELKRVENTPAGKYTYICHQMQRVYTVSLCLYNLKPPDNGGGGGGGKPKKKTPACARLWYSDQFFPTKEIRAPEDCRDEIRDSSHEFFDLMMKPVRAADPGKWAWLPDAAAIDRMSVHQLLTLKQVALEDIGKGSK